MRDRLAHKQWGDAVSLANALTVEETAGQVHLLHGMIAYRRGDLVEASHHFLQVEPRLWASHAPVEGLRSVLKVQPDTGLVLLKKLKRLHPSELPVSSWFQLTGAALGRSQPALAKTLFQRFKKAHREAPRQWRPARKQEKWLAPWIGGNGPHPVPELTDGHVRFGILSFGSPERSSSSWNLGDPVQSLASLGHLVRHRVNFHGDPELVSALEHFQRQVPEELRRTTEAEVDVMIVDRDATRYNNIPENTWMLVIGWWMYPVFGLDYQIPLNPNIKPIILSFYCRHPSFLTEDAVQYLQENGPVGCRDWTTVDLLLKAGVPAFFSGCITSTVSTVFDRERTIDRAETIYVEAPDTPPGAETASQMDDGMRDQSPAAQLLRVHAMLDGYRHFEAVHTKRLHCYMPMRSLGMDVEFLPPNPADPRYPGLAGITDDDFAAIRDGINGLVEPVMSAILQGRDDTTIRELWRELTAERVAAARAQFEAPIRELPEVEGDAERIRAARAAARPVTVRADDADGPAITIVSAVERAQLTPLRVLLTSVMSRTDARVDWLVVATDVPSSSFAASSAIARAAGQFKNLSLHVVDADQVPKDALTLSLPELVDADRIVQLDPESIVLGDIADLAAVDLAGSPLGAATANASIFGSGMEELRTAAKKLRDRERARELRRDALHRQPRDLRMLRTDVLVMDAARVRSTGLGAMARRYAEHLGLDNRQQILLLVGADHIELPDRWTAVAGPEDVAADTARLHYAHEPRPWEPGVGYDSRLWRTERDQF